MRDKKPNILPMITAVVVAVIFACVHDTLANDLIKSISLADSLAKFIESPREFEFTPDSNTTLEDYLQIAMRRSPGLRGAYYEWLAELKRTGYAGALADPMISYSYYVQNISAGLSPDEHMLGIRQEFPWFGTLGARNDIAVESANAAYRKFQAARLRLFYEVKSAYYDYYYLGEEIAITRENMELLRFWESVLESRYKVGLSEHSDLIKAQLELGKLEDQEISLGEMQNPVAARLGSALNLPDSVELPIPGNANIFGFAIDSNSLREAILQNNPNLQAMQHEIEMEKAGVRLAKKSAMPGFSVGMSYTIMKSGNIAGMSGDKSHPLTAEVGLSIPIWLGKNRAVKAEALARREMARYEYDDSRNQLNAYATNVLFVYADALRKTGFYHDGLIPRARESLNAGYVSYQTGKTDFLNVLDAQRQLLDFQLTLENEKVRLAKAAAELEMLSGDKLENYRLNNQNKE